MDCKGKQKQQLHHQQEQQHGVIQSTSPHQTTFMDKEGAAAAAAYDLGELDHALFMYLDGQDQSEIHGQRETLDMFPSRPMSEDQSTDVGVGLPISTCDASMRASKDRKGEPGTARDDPRVAEQSMKYAKGEAMKREREASKKGATSTSERDGTKHPDAKTLRRLAQNREAARKSRLRKKAYVQQLESSRIRLAQLEQELHRAKAQGVIYAGGSFQGDQGQLTSGFMDGMSSGAAIFDMEYARWVEEHDRMMCELRAVLHQQEQQQQVGMEEERELRLMVDGCLSHYDEMISGIKAAAIKSDVFHLVSAAWVSPAERCFFWMAGFRPSHILKVILGHIESPSEQQLLGICRLQQSARDTEEALSRGLENLHKSLSDTVVSDELGNPSDMASYMTQMALAVNKLSAVEDFVRQADGLRQQTLHGLHQLLTAWQAARCHLAAAEYFHRLRALSSLWLTRPRQE